MSFLPLIPLLKNEIILTAKFKRQVNTVCVLSMSKLIVSLSLDYGGFLLISCIVLINSDLQILQNNAL